MAFAGHLKSISLHKSRSEDVSDKALTALAVSEKETLQRQMQEKAAELEKLRSSTVGRQRQQILRTPRTFKLKYTSDDAFVSTKSCEDVVDDRGNTSTRSLWIGNTPHGIKTSDLRTAFGKYGVIESTKSLQDCSFVNFQEVSSAIEAWKDCHEKEIFERGRPLYIRFTRTQADSKKSKDYQTDRTAGFNHRAQAAQLEWFQGDIGMDNLSSSKSGGALQGWPNGNPPSEPKSHRRDVSPPPLQRSDIYRPASRHQHDLYRPSLTRIISSTDNDARPENLRSAYNENTKRRRRSSCDSHSSCSSNFNQLSSASASPHSASNSPLPWERNRYDLHSRTAEQSCSSSLTKPTTASEHSRGCIIEFIARSPGADETSKQICSSPEPLPEHSVGQNVIEDDVSMASDNDPYSPASGVESYTNIQGDGDGEVPVANIAQLVPYPLQSLSNLKMPPRPFLTSASLSAATSGTTLALKQRLLIESDDISSTRSEKSSLSNFSSNDRKCRACKKLGNERGLHVLHKCSRCPRRYHGFCGHPKPNDHTDAALFVCGKCIRQQNKVGKSDGANLDSSRHCEMVQLVSPPLTHTYNDNEANLKQLPLTIDTNYIFQSVATQQYTPTTPAAISDKTENSKSFFGHVIACSAEENSQTDHDSYLRDPGECQRHHTLTQDLDLARMNTGKYKGVTCPWWRKKGAQCWLSMDECLYAHQDTGIYSPDGFKPNKHWTCFQWLQGNLCPQAEWYCLYAHNDTGLYTWKDGRASLKHVTCYWWITRYCKYADHDCRFAHADTGLYSRDPSEKQSGMAISTHRPPAGLNSSGQDHSNEFRHRSEHQQLNNESQSSLPGSFQDPCKSPNRDSVRSLLRESDCSTVISNALATSCEPSISCTGFSMDKADKIVSERLTAMERSIAPVADVREVGPNGATWPRTHDVVESSVDNPGEGGIAKSSFDDILEQQRPQQTIPKPMTTTTAEPSQYSLDLAGPSPNHSCNGSGTNQQTTQDPRKRPRSFTNPMAKSNMPLDTQAQASAYIEIEVERVKETILSKSEVAVKEPSLLPSKNIRKCEFCAKTVFSGRVCRDCRIGQLTPNKPDMSPQVKPNGMVNQYISTDEISQDSIVQVVQSDLGSAATLEKERKTQVVSKLPVKRSSSGADMFIPNKRARGSMLFSSSGSIRTDTPVTAPNKVQVMRAAGGMRKAPAPTIDQLIRKYRLENNQISSQDSLSTRSTDPRSNATPSSPNDKENQMPVVQDALSPSTAPGTASPIYPSPMDERNDGQSTEDSREKTTTYLNNDTMKDIRSQILDGNSTLRATDLQNTRIRPVDRLYPSTVSSKVAVSVNETQESSTDGSSKTDENGSFHLMQEAAPILREGKDNTEQERESQKLVSSNSLKVNPFICRTCRSHHKKCLHSKTNTRALDPKKCHLYLQDRKGKRDTGRTIIDWNNILEAATTYQNLDPEKHIQKESAAATTINVSGGLRNTDLEIVSDKFPDEHTSSVDDIEASEQLLLDMQAVQIRVSQRRQSKANHTGLKAIGVTDPDASQQTSPTARSFSSSQKSKLVFDVEHVRQLKGEGVMFESDEDEDDYLSDDQVVTTPRRPPIDALHVSRTSSGDLFTICPELHPDHPKFNSTRYNAKPKTKVSRKIEWAELKKKRFNDRRELFNDPHWEVDRGGSQVRVETLIERLVPAVDAEVNRFSIPSISKKEEQITFQEFLGGPRQPEACLMTDRHLALRDGARDLDQNPFTRTLRGFGKKSTDDDKWPVNSK